MSRLTSRTRARLPDRAFAHVDAHGRRRLPAWRAPKTSSRSRRMDCSTSSHRPGRNAPPRS